MRDDAKDTAAREDPKKPYTEPRLIEYGSVAKLTQSGSGNKNDGGGGGMMRVCL